MTSEKFVLGRGAARHTNRAASTPSRGRRCKASRQIQPQARPGSPYDGRRHPRRRAATFASLTCAPAGVSRSPNAHSRAPGPKQRAQAARLGDSFYFAKSKIVESLLRRGARGELSRRARTALKPHRLPTKAKKTPAKAPAGPPAGRAMLRIAGACRARKTSSVRVLAVSRRYFVLLGPDRLESPSKP